ncbi:MAG: RNA polymerase subunit sigma-70, partial [Planctomycetia bacterium]|nr:RNA polymerase subunit sigma-70 [Planctomycetia bacterium]
MAHNELGCVLDHVRKLIGIERESELTDGQLLERFVGRRDEAAFETLVRRHGPMVQRVCRRVLNDAHAAEDAFQATFLVLARKANA